MSAESVLVKLQWSHLSTEAAISHLQDVNAGAIAIFLGTTRQWTSGRETRKLEYEAYEPMAIREMEKLVQEARKRWPLLRVAVLHRLGDVPIAEVSIIVGVSSVHRKAAFDACQFIIDNLKEKVPIWKNEHYADGTTEWIGIQ